MLLQIKIDLIAVIYILGGVFMFLFPPRNFKLSGSKIRTKRYANDEIKFTEYIDYNNMWSTLKAYAERDPDVVNLIPLQPQTAENRSIFAVELHSDKNSRKPGIFVIGGLDAMAWGAPNAIMELADKLLYDASYQTPFFNDYDWYLIPMANPDGIAFTQSLRSRRPSRFGSTGLLKLSNNTSNLTYPIKWHKNVENAGKTPCFGTNINRNFAYHWQDDVRKTPQQCSQFYPGIKPFSTAEAKAIRAYVDKLGDIISLAIHLHTSFVPKKEYILYPWRYSLRQISNHRLLQSIGEYAARKARLPDGRLYEVHQSSSDERVAGTLSDYLCGVVGIDLVYFLRPYHQIFPNYSDTSAIRVYMKKSVTTIISVVRGWRRSTKLNTLYFFGREIEF